MKHRFIQFATMALAALVMAAPAVAYDRGLAEEYVKMFEPVQGPKAGKELHLIKPDQFVNEVKAGKQFVTVDTRTQGETRFFYWQPSRSPRNPAESTFRARSVGQIAQ